MVRVWIGLVLFYHLLHGISSLNPPPSTAGPRNVLLMIADDMRPEIGAYGVPNIYTPNLDALASQSMLFRHAHVQQAACSPSRTSFLTGRRPDTTRVIDLIQYWRKVGGNFTTLPQYFKEQGYLTAGFGKIFHSDQEDQEDPISWTEPHFHPDEKYWKSKPKKTWSAVEKTELERHPLPDMQTTEAVIGALQNLSHSRSTARPFFLAVGFQRPHLPFVFPSTFLQLYSPDTIKLPNNPYAPQDMPEVAWSNYDELRDYADVRTLYGYGALYTTLPDHVGIDLKRAYYASVSYVDSLVGIILEKLSSLGLENDTMVLFMGDHGWQLGEHGEWCKHTNFDQATRTPLLFSLPGVTDLGRVTDQLVEFVDIFPSIIEAAGLPTPPLCPKNSSHIRFCTEGSSFYQLLKDPEREWKTAIFTQYPRMVISGNVVMGYSVRTHSYRYTEWVYYDTFESIPLWDYNWEDKVELYDYGIDPDGNVNVAYWLYYSKIRGRLSKILRAGWRSALPPS